MFNKDDEKYVIDNYVIEDERRVSRLPTRLERIDGTTPWEVTSFNPPTLSLTETLTEIDNYKLSIIQRVVEMVRQHVGVDVEINQDNIKLTRSGNSIYIVYMNVRKETLDETMVRLVHVAKQTRLKALKTEQADKEREKNNQNYKDYIRLKKIFEK